MKRKLEKLLKKYGMENRTLRGIWAIHTDKNNKKCESAKKDTWELCYCLVMYNYFKKKMNRTQNASEV